MKEFTALCSWIFILSLLFLFWGEPDVWDAMRVRAMSGSTIMCEEKP